MVAPIAIHDCPPDDATVAYALESQRAFEDLRQVLAQVGGVLVLAAAGGRSATPDHPMLGAARELYRNAAERLKSLAVTPRARHHHLHLLAASEALERALAAMARHLHRRANGIDIDHILKPLHAAQREMEWVARLLPGFDLVDFGHGCCAEHHAQNQKGGRA